jgi:hypothetical protein
VTAGHHPFEGGIPELRRQDLVFNHARLDMDHNRTVAKMSRQSRPIAFSQSQPSCQGRV